MLSVKKLRENLIETLRGLRLENGLYLASTGPHYKYIWTRDSFYESLPELELNPKLYEQTYQTLLDYHINIEEEYGKISDLIRDPDLSHGKEWRFPHPRYNKDLTEIRQNWGFIQLDTIGELLYGIYLGESTGNIHIIRDDRDRNILQSLIDMLVAIKYWQVEDNGIWEEYREIHSSSIGAVVAGLTAARLLGFKVDQEVIDKGHEVLNALLPRESMTKDVDLALLTLIFPFNIVTAATARQIIANVEAKLLKEKGVIRYHGDEYYKHENIVSPWCMGLSLLALSYYILGEMDKAKHYAKLVLERTIVDGDKIPEMFLGDTDVPNDNRILGWSNSLGYLCLDFIDV